MTGPPHNDGGAAAAAGPALVSSRDHAKGLVLVVLVAFIWVGSAELIQHIFGASSFDKPFFLTYFSTSLFSLYLCGFCLLPSWRASLFAPPGASDNAYVGLSPLDGDAVEEAEEEEALGYARGASRPDVFNAEQTRSIGLCLAPLFFVSNYAFNMGLEGTSVASSSTISTLSTLFGLLLGTVAGVERFSWTKLASSLVTVLGVGVISLQDRKNSGSRSFAGDAISVASAFVFGCYAIQLKKRVPSEECASMAMVFGYMGAYCAALGWPFLFLLDCVGWEVWELPSGRVIGLLAINALVGTVLSDYLWARSVALTTPVIATLALSLTLPLSLLCDVFFRGVSFTWPYYVGVGVVLVGFVAANVEEAYASSHPGVS